MYISIPIKCIDKSAFKLYFLKILLVFGISYTKYETKDTEAILMFSKII